MLISDTDGVYEKDKERLANMMAYGEDIAPASGETSGKVFLRRPEKEEDESDEEIDRFQECKIRPCSCEHRPNSFFWTTMYVMYRIYLCINENIAPSYI